MIFHLIGTGSFLLSDVCYSKTRSFYRNLIVTTDKGVSILDMSVKRNLFLHFIFL